MNHIQEALIKFTKEYVEKLEKRISDYLKSYRDRLMGQLPEDPHSLQLGTKISEVENQEPEFLANAFIDLIKNRTVSMFYTSDAINQVFGSIPEVIEKTNEFKEAKQKAVDEYHELDKVLDLEYKRIKERAEELKLEIISTPEYTPDQALTMRNKIKGELEQLCRIPEQSQ